MIAMQVEPMGKKKSKAPPKGTTRKPMVVQIRGSEEWKRWAEMIAEKEGDTLSKLFERSLRKFAREAGYPDPPRR
jgi:hypothetical protein